MNLSQSNFTILDSTTPRHHHGDCHDLADCFGIDTKELDKHHEMDTHDDHSHERPEYTFTEFDTFTTAFSIFVSIFVEFGNTLTLMAIFKSSRLRTIPNLYISSLALADMLVGFLLFVKTVCSLPFIGRDILDTTESACLVLMSLLFVSVFASLLSSLLVACDRSLYIHQSIHYGKLMTKLRALKLISISWILALIFGTIPLYTSHFSSYHGCSPTHVFNVVYMIVVSPTIFFSVCLTIVILYLSIVITAMRQRQKIEHQTRANGSYNGSGSSDSGERSSSVSSRSWHIVKTLMLLFGLFFVCWSPLIILIALEYTVHVSHDALTFGGLLAIVNSGLNFLVLSALNKDFRFQYARLLGIHTLSCCHGNRVHPEGVSIQTENGDSVVEVVG